MLPIGKSLSFVELTPQKCDMKQTFYHVLSPGCPILTSEEVFNFWEFGQVKVLNLKNGERGQYTR